jgi:hypothetical protein
MLQAPDSFQPGIRTPVGKPPGVKRANSEPVHYVQRVAFESRHDLP